METEIVAPSDAVETPAAPIANTEGSLSDHEAQFDRSLVARAARETAEETEQAKPEDKTRHRAQSQKATPADVPRINSLTKQLRAAQAELARLKGTDAPPQQRQAPAQAQAPQERPQAAEPTRSLSEFVDSPDVSQPRLNENKFFELYPTAPYETFQEYIASYRQAAADQKRQQTQAETQRTHVQQHVSDISAERLKQFGSDVSEFVSTRPDFKQKADAAGDLMNVPLPDLLTEALIASGPEMYYHLVSNPALLAEMHLLSDGKAVTDSNVAIVQRRLSSELAREQAAVTGSVATPQPRISAPRPPNPVRTGPMKTGVELPGDGHSLADHAKHFSPKRR